MRILVLCTANVCRSPMAERLLRHHAAARHVDATVDSAGLLAGGRAASDGSVRALTRLGIGLDDHQSRELTVELLDAADLVLAMEARHVREATVLAPHRFSSIYTVRELVTLAEPVGPRGDRRLDEWLADVGAGRTGSSLIGATDLDVADPYGGPDAGYLRTAAELVELTDTIAGHLWGPLPSDVPPLDASVLTEGSESGTGSALGGWLARWRRPSRPSSPPPLDAG